MLGSKVLDLKDQEQKTLNIIDEQLDVIGMAFIGQNIGCARCHDQKFDPIPTTDYYALAGILKSSVTMDENDERGHFMVQRPLANQSKLEAFEKAQEVITFAEKELSDIIVDANDQLRLQRIGNLAQYLLAADQSQRVSENISSNRKKIDPAVLDPDIVRRLSDWLQHSEGTEVPIFMVWNVFSETFHAKSADSPAKLNQLSQSLRQRSNEDPGSVSAYTLRMRDSGPPASLEELATRYQQLFLTLDELLKAHLDFYLLREELDSQCLAQEENTEIPDNAKLSDHLKEQTKLTEQSLAIAAKTDNIETRLGASSGSGVLKNLKAVKNRLQKAIKAQQEAQEKLISGGKRENPWNSVIRPTIFLSKHLNASRNFLRNMTSGSIILWIKYALRESQDCFLLATTVHLYSPSRQRNNGTGQTQDPRLRNFGKILKILKLKVHLNLLGH